MGLHDQSTQKKGGEGEKENEREREKNLAQFSYLFQLIPTKRLVVHGVATLKNSAVSIAQNHNGDLNVKCSKTLSSFFPCVLSQDNSTGDLQASKLPATLPLPLLALLSAPLPTPAHSITPTTHTHTHTHTHTQTDCSVTET